MLRVIVPEKPPADPKPLKESVPAYVVFSENGYVGV